MACQQSSRITKGYSDGSHSSAEYDGGSFVQYDGGVVAYEVWVDFPSTK